ncbi:MAG: biopolymer transporter ExbD, partial [Gammaproteobacteria bacterium]|nr:biopolymer transporter ExbD [Gammaproteobacteria bacterium]
KQLVNTQLRTLKQALKKVAGDNRKMAIIVSADANTPHQSVVTAMDAARQMGFTRLSFATQQFSK